MSNVMVIYVIYVNRIFLRQDKSAHKNFIVKATMSVSDTYQGLYNWFFYFPLWIKFTNYLDGKLLYIRKGATYVIQKSSFFTQGNKSKQLLF